MNAALWVVVGYLLVATVAYEVCTRSWLHGRQRPMVDRAALACEMTPRGWVALVGLLYALYWPLSVPMSAWLTVSHHLRDRRTRRRNGTEDSTGPQAR